MDKDHVREEVASLMRSRFESEQIPCACVYWAGYACDVLARQGIRALIQAGSFSWPCRAADWKDDGVSFTHLSYIWDKQEAAGRLAVGQLPELHAWAAIPETQEIIDFTTCYVPEQCERILKIKWQAPKPPPYLWCAEAGIPDGVIYRPDLDAIRFALMVWTQHKKVPAVTTFFA